jgi:hypothetical protein
MIHSPDTLEAARGVSVIRLTHQVRWKLHEAFL